MSGLVIFLLALMIGGSQACRCALLPFNVKYCNSAFAFVAEVSDVGADSQINVNSVVYTLDVTAIFKDDSQTINLGQNSVKTASSSAACGVTLQKGNSYFLTGYITNEAQDLHLNSCGSVVINLANLSFKEYNDILSAVFNPQGLCANKVEA